jgi:glycerophosphoryl diester phosphodiesterase
MTSPFPQLLVLGHRGAPDEELENTLASFARAVAHGAHGVEIDVRPAADGTPIVIHDDALERTFGVRGSVASLSWPSLQRLTGARLPSLQQVAAWAAAAGAWLNVELKAGGAEEAALEIVRSHGLCDRCFFSSFDDRLVARIGELDPDASRFLLAEEWNDSVRNRLVASGAAGLCLRVDAASALTLESLRQEGLPVVVWTVDDAERIGRLVRSGVAALITNRPAEAVAAVRGTSTG